jgi:hypothetical protein
MWYVYWLIEHYIITILLLGIIGYIVTRYIEETVRGADIRRKLLARYNDLVTAYGDEKARKIWNHELWRGMIVAELEEAWGHPDDIEPIVTARTNKEVWKYDPVAYGAKVRYGRNVTLEDGFVIAWHGNHPGMP